jgi:hypothetical protein
VPQRELPLSKHGDPTMWGGDTASGPTSDRYTCNFATSRTSKVVASCPGLTSAPSKSKLASTSMAVSTGRCKPVDAALAAAAAAALAASADCPCCFASLTAAPLCRMAASVGAAAWTRLGRHWLWLARAPMTSWASGAIKGSDVCCSHTCRVSNMPRTQSQHIA